MNQRTFFENFDVLADVPDGVQKLRELILQMAIYGKLVTQDLNEESVFKLLEKIKSDKNQLIQKRKLKLKNISENNDVMILKYKIPSNWCWFRLPEVVFFQEGPGIRNWQFKSHGIKLLNVQNILPNNKTLFEKSDKYVSEEEVKEKYEHFLIEEGDLLFAASGGSWGKSAWFYDPGYKIMLNTSTIRLKFFSDEFEPNYLKCFLDSSFFKTQMELQLVGMQPNFGSTHLGRVYIPIPPLEEQKRIVAKVDQLMAFCDELESRQQKKHEIRILLNNAALDKLLTAPTPEEFAQHWQRICDNFDLLYDAPETVGQLRQAILQLAVQGKLEARDEGGEPAAMLLEKIRAKKEKIMKEKKLKKIKTLPVTESEKNAIGLPEGWELVRLGEIVQKLGAGSTPKGGKAIYQEAGIKFIRSQNVWNNGLSLQNVAYIPLKIHERMNGTVVKPGDILLNITGASIGRSVLVPDDFDEGNVSQHVAIIRLIDNTLNYYLHLYLISPFIKNKIMDVQVGISREGLSMSRLKDFLIPIPPLSEANRIVAKVDQLMVLCDELEAGLVQVQTDGGRLMGSVVSKLVDAY